MKRIHISEDKFRLIRESWDDEEESEAGTDFPRFYDKKTDMLWEASWNGDYAFPFGYWLVNGSYEFSVGDPWTTHLNACGKVAKKYLASIFEERYEYEASDFVSELEELVDELEENYTYNSDTDVFVSNDGDDEIELSDWTYEHCDGLNPNIMLQYVEDAVHKGDMPSEYDIAYDMANAVLEDVNINDKKSLENVFYEYTMSNFDSFFGQGYGEGRIWPQLGLITFYVSEQPTPDVFCSILQELSNHEDINESYEGLMDYFTIFEDFDNDNVVTGCTVRDYISGNYGPETDEEGEEPDLERERTFGNGDTKFIPHLASPEEKRRLDVFKGWREAGARKWAPRLKGFGGNMAAYRAARYPYSDSRIIRGNVLNESSGRKRKKV